MFTKEQFIKTLRHETHICKHLFGKMPEGGLDYRPTPEQRSMLELLQYLTAAVIVPTKAIVSSDWSQVRATIETYKKLTAEDFCAAMDRQCEEVEKILEGISEKEMLERDAQTPMGPFKLGEALVIFPLKFIACYRMQLFLYLKSAGVSSIGTYNCWGGIDAPQGETPGH